MRVKIFVISFCAFLFSFLIFDVYSDDRLHILSIGDDLSLGATPFESYGESYNDFLKDYLFKNNLSNNYNDFFLSEGETYESMIHKFDDDYYVNVKNDKVSLRTSIAKADVIVLGLSHEKTLNKCGLPKSKFIDYLNSYFESLNKFIDKINKISVSDIVVLGGYCYEYNEEINQHIIALSSQLESKVYYINLYQDIHDNNFYVPNKKNPFPSLEGYDYIFKRIVFTYDFSKNKD